MSRSATALGLGCMALSGTYGPPDRVEGVAVVRAALDAGITLLDTGDFYGMGDNELLLAHALRGVPRDRYRRYLSQVRCLSARLTSFFASLERAGALENSVVVVLGDHGPRIGLRRPSPGNLGSVKTVDYVDGFSTLFAARGPGIEPGLDPDPRSIARAFAEAVGFPGPPPETDELLLPQEGEPILVPVPMPSF